MRLLFLRFAGCIALVTTMLGCGSSSEDAETCDRACASRAMIADGWLDIAHNEGASVSSWPQQLEKGSAITDGPFGEEEPIAVQEPSWLFFVDLRPQQSLGHPTELVLVSAKGGKVTAHFRHGYPVLDGVALFTTSDELASDDFMAQGFPRPNESSQPLTVKPPTPVDTGVVPDSEIDWDANPRYRDEPEDEYQLRVRGKTERPQSVAAMEAELAKCGCEEGSGKRFALVIDGGQHGLDAATPLAKSLRAGGVSTRFLSPHVDGGPDAEDANTSMEALEKAFAWLGASVADCCDSVLIYIHAHGNAGGQMLMNAPRTVPVIADGKPTGETRVEGNPKGSMANTAELRRWLDLIKSCDVEVVISSCYGGNHLEKGVNIIDEKQAKAGCMCRTVMSVGSARQSIAQAYAFTTAEAVVGTPGGLRAALLAVRKSAEEQDKVAELAEFHFTPQVQATDCVLCDDPDQDGILTGVEWKSGLTDPENKDSDGDLLDDGQEAQKGTKPDDPDSDDDGLSDGLEVLKHGSDPNSEDGDHDGVTDKNEVFGGTLPMDEDTDNDGLKDGEEYEHATDPNNDDSDGDGLKDGAEILKKTDPLDTDSDDDGLTDGYEVANGSDPLDPSSPG